MQDSAIQMGRCSAGFPVSELGNTARDLELRSGSFAPAPLASVRSRRFVFVDEDDEVEDDEVEDDEVEDDEVEDDEVEDDEVEDDEVEDGLLRVYARGRHARAIVFAGAGRTTFRGGSIIAMR